MRFHRDSPAFYNFLSREFSDRPPVFFIDRRWLLDNSILDRGGYLYAFLDVIQSIAPIKFRNRLDSLLYAGLILQEIFAGDGCFLVSSNVVIYWTVSNENP